MYGNRVGITNETKKRPQITKLLNKYLVQEGGPGNWAAIRVTSGFTSGIHVDRNQKGTKNLFVPISRFRAGRIWIEGCSGLGEKAEPRILDWRL